MLPSDWLKHSYVIREQHIWNDHVILINQLRFHPFGSFRIEHQQRLAPESACRRHHGISDS